MGGIPAHHLIIVLSPKKNLPSSILGEAKRNTFPDPIHKNPSSFLGQTHSWSKISPGSTWYLGGYIMNFSFGQLIHPSTKSSCSNPSIYTKISPQNLYPDTKNVILTLFKVPISILKPIYLTKFCAQINLPKFHDFGKRNTPSFYISLSKLIDRTIHNGRPILYRKFWLPSLVQVFFIVNMYKK